MLDFTMICKPNGSPVLETSLTGKALLTVPQLNKGTAFSQEERIQFQLLGKLPSRVETLEEQVHRCYQQYCRYTDKVSKNIFLNQLQDTNLVLFYSLVSRHLKEMLPIIYTPIVGTAVKQFNQEFRQTRGLYLSYPDRKHLSQILDNRSNPEIDLIVVTDGEGVLGIGDQGVGGMDIPVAKLMVYTLCGGINPCRTLPILLDVGTNNQQLLDDPMYLGWHHQRLDAESYDEFVDEFIAAVNKKFPNVFLHWEDLGARNARRNLECFRDKHCTFNDDMQGTGVVTLSAIIAAVKSKQEPLADQRIIVFGAGTAGTGIADQIKAALMLEGSSDAEAAARFWLIDKPGLLTDEMQQVNDFQKPYLRPHHETQHWSKTVDGQIDLLEVVKQIKPTILIGCSSQPGRFTQEIVQTMAKNVNRPIILPLSNPTERAEATPAQLFAWTDGRVMLATGSPFADVVHNSKKYPVAQCNNALVFPGIGLGIIASKSRLLTDGMLWQACLTLANTAPILSDPEGAILPPIEHAQMVAKKIALAIAEQAIVEKQATFKAQNRQQIEAVIDAYFWHPNYVPYTLRS